MHCDKGSVSIFLIVIIAAVFLFNAVLIDFVRYKSAEREAELAIRTSVRSTLSAFDLPLNTYGLFALAPDQMQVKDQFTQVLKQNLSSDQEQAFAYLQLRIEGEPAVQTMYSLANRSVFERQVLENMKYIAPIELTRRLFEPLKGIAGEVSSASKFSRDAETVDALVEDRENRLDQAWKLAADSLRRTETMRERYDSDLNELQKAAEQIGNRSKEEVRENISSLQEDLDDASPEKRSSIRKKISKLRKTLSQMDRYEKLVATLKTQSASDESTLANVNSAFAQQIDEARNLNNRINEKVREIREKNGENSPLNEMFSGLQTIGEEECIELKREFSQAVSTFSIFKAEVQRLTETSYRQSLPSDQSYVREMRDFYEKHNEKQQKRQAANSEKRQKKAEATKKAEAELERARKKVVASCVPDDAKYYAQLEGSKGFTRKYLQYNEAANSAENDEDVSIDGQAKELAKTELSIMESALSLLGSFRDRLYVNEYVLHHFNYRTHTKMNDIDKLSKPAAHPLKDQEAEYVLYGNSSCDKNMASAYAELFLVRMTIRTSEALLHPQKALITAGSPMIGFLIAVAEGALEAHTDTDKLLKGEELEISANLPEIKLNYADYLRLFMLLHGSNVRMSARTQALVELNTGVDLKQKYTYVAAHADVSLKLWFLPAAIKALNRLTPEDTWFGEVKNGRLNIFRAAEMSY